MGKTQNELSLKGRKRERTGVGACGEGKGAVSKIPNWEGKETGDQLPPPDNMHL